MPIECQCTCGSNSVCRQAKATAFDFSCAILCVHVVRGPREQIALFVVPAAAECNQATRDEMGWLRQEGEDV